MSENEMEGLGVFGEDFLSGDFHDGIIQRERSRQIGQRKATGVNGQLILHLTTQLLTSHVLTTIYDREKAGVGGGAQWVETVCRRRVLSYKKTSFPLAKGAVRSKLTSEWCERMSEWPTAQ